MRRRIALWPLTRFHCGFLSPGQRSRWRKVLGVIGRRPPGHPGIRGSGEARLCRLPPPAATPHDLRGGRGPPRSWVGSVDRAQFAASRPGLQGIRLLVLPARLPGRFPARSARRPCTQRVLGHLLMLARPDPRARWERAGPEDDPSGARGSGIATVPLHDWVQAFAPSTAARRVPKGHFSYRASLSSSSCSLWCLSTPVLWWKPVKSQRCVGD